MCVSGAVHRYYESRRRLFNDEQPGRRDVAREMKVQSKKKALQRKVRVVLNTIIRRLM